MYKQLTDKQIGEHFFIVPNDVLGDLHQTRLKKIFPNVDLEDAFVLYITTDEYPIFIGYFILDETHITASPLLESYRQNMIAAGEDDPLIELRNEHCLHLRSWVLDKQLDNKKAIKRIVHIASIIATENCNRPNILWCECGDELLCYRIAPNLLKQISQTLLILRYISLKEAGLNK